MKIDEQLRKRLIDAIATGKTDAIKEALDEVQGKIFRVRNFVDIMIASAIHDTPNNTTKVIYDLEPDVKKGFEEIVKRIEDRNN